MTLLARLLPLIAVNLAAIYLVFVALAPKNPADEFQVYEFGKIPIVDHGRVKPIDSLARNSLMILSGRQEFRDEKGRTQPANQWLLDVASSDFGSQERKIFRIDNERVLKFLALAPRPEGRYSLDDLKSMEATLLQIAKHIGAQDEKGKGPTTLQWMLEVMTSDSSFLENKVFQIDNKKALIQLSLKPRPEGRYSLEDLIVNVPSLLEVAAHADELAPRVTKAQEAKQLLDLSRQVEQYIQLGRREGKFGNEDATRQLLDLARQVEQYVYFGRYDTRHKVFRIENDQVLSLLGLKPRPGLRYGFDEFSAKVPQLVREMSRVQETDEKKRDVYESKILELTKHVQLYLGLAKLETETLLVIPPLPGRTEWQTPRQAKRQSSMSGAEDPAARAFESLLDAYAQGNAEAFNRELGGYRAKLQHEVPSDLRMARFETFFNRFAPFYHCLILYVVIFLIACISWLGIALSWQGFARSLVWTALCLAVLTLMVHTFALFARMYLMDRPFVFVTNLYSSAVFIGWVCVAVAIVVEGIFKNGIGNVVGAVLGFLSLIIAHNLARSGDTLEMMQAVLDTNFWLATHVTAVTIGYAATFVAGKLGILFILFGIATPLLNRDLYKVLGQIIYGVVCFATLFSFTGTVLGGIWADYSWGRFWGWDPKENGALLIVLWNVLVLHARWGGMVKQRGLAVLVIVGNMVTAWSWFGTNQLGVGLHAYGFNKTLAEVLVWFWYSQLLFIGIGLVPTRYWWSMTAVKSEAVSPPRRARPVAELT